MKEMEITDKFNLLVWNTRESRDPGKKLVKTRHLRNINEHSCPYRHDGKWNALKKEIVRVKNVYEFQARR